MLRFTCVARAAPVARALFAFRPALSAAPDAMRLWALTPVMLAAPAAALPAMMVAATRAYNSFGRSERGVQRKSFEEREAARIPKTREQKRESEARALDAERYVDAELPDLCKAETEKVVEKAAQIVRRLLHPDQALFDVTVDIAGQQKPLAQLATIVKASAREFDVVPNSGGFLSPILLRLSRYDSSLNARKMDNKVRLTVPQMTRNKRLAAADSIKELTAKSHKHFQLLRREAIARIDELALSDDVTRTRKAECEEIIKAEEASLAAAIDEQVQAVQQAASNADEDDENGAAPTGSV
jgi:ribosome recycling factor